MAQSPCPPARTHMPPDAATADPDAPVRIHRRSAELRPSAVHMALTVDMAIAKELERALGEHLGLACRVDVRVVDGRVTLSGHVTCLLTRLLAEDLAYAVGGVRECSNVLRVISDDAARGS
jgi:hypothetical protein